MSDKYDLSVVLRVLDRASAPLSKIGAKFRQLTRPINAADKRMRALGKSIQKVGKGMSQVGRSMSMKMTLPLTIMAGLATRASINFESAFTGVRKTVSATEEEFAVLKKGLMGIARVIPISTQEIFGIAEAAGQLGIENKSIQDFTKVMADLGATTNLSADEAATQLARFANITGMSQGEFQRLGSTIVDLGNNMATTEAEIVGMGMRLAGAGKLVGISEPKIMGLAAALTSVGIRAEAGGTAFSQVMRKIDKEIGSGSDEMQGFAYVSGMTVKDFETLWKKNASEAILKFTEGLGRVQKEGKNVNLILDELGMDGMRIADSLLRASGSGKLFRDAMTLGNKAWKENIALTKEANLRYATTASQLKIAMNKVTQMAAAFGDILKKALISVVDWLMPVIEWLTKLSPTSKKIIIIIGALVAAIGPLLIAFGFIATALGGIMAIGVPALLALAAPIAAVVLAIGAIGFAVMQVIRHWDDLKAIFGSWKGFSGMIIAAWGGVKDFFVDLFNVIKSAIGGLSDIFAEVFGTTITYWMDKIKGILDLLPDFIKKKLGIEVEVEVPDMAETRKKIEEERSKIAKSEAGENVYFGREAKGREESLAKISELESLLKTPARTVAAVAPARTVAETPARTVAAVAGAQKSETDINIKVTADPGSTATVEKVKKKKGDANVSAATLGYVGAY